MPRRILILLAVLGLLLAGCSSGDDEGEDPATTTTTESTGATGDAGSADPEPVTPPEPEGIASEPPPAQAAPGAEGKGTELYFTAGEQFRKVTRPLAGGGSEVLRAAEALVAGPTKADARGGVKTETAIPAGVDVEGIEVDDGVATVKVSDEFLAGVPADPAQRTRADREALDARVGQVAYTLTQFTRVDEARVESGGVEVGGPRDRGELKKPASKPGPITHAKGSPEPGIQRIQRRLARLRYLPKSGVDGLNGYATQQAVIAFQSWEGLARDGIVGPQTRAALRDANRPRPGKTGPATRIEVYRQKGVALLVQEGRTKRAIHVSTGKASTPTPSGTYSVFRKEKMSWSYPFQQWLPFASYFNNGIAFHEYKDIPTYPASAGCVRVPSPDARRVYRFAKFGTAVVVF